MKDEQKFVNQRLKYLNTEVEVNIFGIHNETDPLEENYKRLVFHARTYEDNTDDEKIKLPKRLLNSCFDFDLAYNFDDIHLYIFNKSVYSILEDPKIEKLNLIKSDLIPYLINNYTNRRLRNLVSSYNIDKNVHDLPNEKKIAKSLKLMCLILEGRNYA